MTIYERAQQILNIKPLQPCVLDVIGELTNNEEHWILSRNQILEALIKKLKLNDIQSWDWEKLYGYKINFRHPALNEVMLITSCDNQKLIKSLLEKTTEANTSIDELLKLERYVAITATFKTNIEW